MSTVFVPGPAYGVKLAWFRKKGNVNKLYQGLGKEQDESREGDDKKFG